MYFPQRPVPITRSSVFGIKRRMKKVLVTGSSRGIGRAIAVDLAKAGYDPVVHCVKSLDEARETAAELKSLGASGDVLFFDVSNREETAAALNGYVEETGAFYGVVLNAGIVADNSFPSMEGDEWDRVIRTDLDSFYNVLKPLVMPMVLQRVRGRIVVISSISGVNGNVGQSNYAAAKAGLIGAAKSLAVELAPRGITVNCVAPGFVETAMTASLDEAQIVKSIPMRRFAKPAEVASLVRYLLSDEASYITRQVIRIDGGMS